MNIDIAVGEVSWERELLSALAAHPDLDIGRRLVDLALVEHSATPLITCPSVRGFTEERIRRLMAHRPVIIIADSIRPPWLIDHGITFHDAAVVDFQDVVSECANIDPSPRLQLVQQPNRGRLTAFVGVSGGVGVSTLVWTYARCRPSTLIVDANVLHPSLGMLVDAGVNRDSYRIAVREYLQSGSVDFDQIASQQRGGACVLTLPIDEDVRGTLRDDDAWRFLLAATSRFDDVILDAGIVNDDVELLRNVDRVILVTTATPLGLVRLCTRATVIREHAQRLDIVVNRVRGTAAGSRHATTAIRELVRAELGQEPTLVEEDVVACDRGWLTGDWDLELALAELPRGIGSKDDPVSPIHRISWVAGD